MMTAATAISAEQPDVSFISNRFPGYSGPRDAVLQIWEPNAKQVCVVGPFNGWDGRWHVMDEHAGVWSLYIPELELESVYKFEIITQDNEAYLKSAAYALPAKLLSDAGSGRGIIV
ncbi:MAG: glgB [Paenibacillus sp.]|jgi:1,4-alpha-glucan branching enzyme|nr:glgB [Paenibacillus sp.]